MRYAYIPVFALALWSVCERTASAQLDAPGASQVLPSFEVVSVKPAGPDGPNDIGLYTYPGGRIRANNYTLLSLILNAFDLQYFQVSGGPRWMDLSGRWSVR